MKPGLELDLLIAKEVMKFDTSPLHHVFGGSYPGVCIYCHQPGWHPQYSPRESPCCPKYSTSISDAWQVVEKLKPHEDYVEFHLTDDEHSSIAIWAEAEGVYFSGFCLGTGEECAAGESAPHAICLAALKAVRSSFERINETK